MLCVASKLVAFAALSGMKRTDHPEPGHCFIVLPRPVTKSQVLTVPSSDADAASQASGEMSMHGMLPACSRIDSFRSIG